MSNVESDQSRVIERDLEGLRSENPSIRFNTSKIYKLLSEADPRIIERLVQLLQDKDMWVQIAATESLENLSVKEAIDPLKPLLKHEHTLVRLHAARALEKLTGESFGFAPEAMESAYETFGSVIVLSGILKEGSQGSA